jgi:hypothetical protein
VALNKYGDIPNLGTQAKRARRRKNRELRESDPGKYKGVIGTEEEAPGSIHERNYGPH